MKSIKAGKPTRTRRRTLKGVSDIRRYFHRNEEPIYFISATNFNLLGIDEWVRNFIFISHIDCFDGSHPNLFTPKEIPHEPFTSIEDINNYLLRHPDVRALLKSRAVGGKAGKVVFLMFDEKTEELCAELGLEICFPPARLRNAVDDKISATRIAAKAGVKCVPNVLAKVDSWETLRKVSKRLGKQLVVQTAFGDSGHTTFFISNRKDWAQHADEITGADEVKVMQRIRCKGSAIEACVTRHGTLVGPLMTELVGFPELTPYKGGWCGNEVFADAFPPRIRNAARRDTFRFGEELRRMGYRGYFELDFLVDEVSEKLYMGEVNPRITGASSMTNLACFAHADAPLFLFHMLEFMDHPYELDVEEINARWSDPEYIDSWGQMVIKYTGDDVGIASAAPATGVWQLAEDGTVHFMRAQTHRRTVRREDRAFFLRITRPGDYLYEGADLGILVTPGRLMDSRNSLNGRAHAWIRGIRRQFQGRPLGARETAPAPVFSKGGHFKVL